MHTYVINTSENKNFDGNLLFGLARYEQIRWKSCSLSDIRTCAEEIFSTEDSRIASDDMDFRVVVLVDLFDFSIEKDGAWIPTGTDGDYVEIYKFFIEHYLLTNLFDYLKKKHVPAKACELYYIQYTAHTPVSQNEKEKEQTAMLFGRFDDAKREQALRKARTSLDPACDDFDLPPQEEATDGEIEKYADFTLHCSPTLKLCFRPLDTTEAISFDEFYQSYRIYHRNDAIKFPIVVHEPYVTFGDNPIRAAYDTLVLSLYLVHAYERPSNSESKRTFRRPDANALESVFVRAYQRVYSARIESQKNNVTFFYPLDCALVDSDMSRTQKESAEAVKAAKGTDQKKDKKGKKEASRRQQFRDQYHAILAYTEDNGKSKIHEDTKAIFQRYHEKRDVVYDDMEPQLSEATETVCPSEIEKNQQLEKCREALSGHLARALQAGYRDNDLGDMRLEAETIHRQYAALDFDNKRRLYGILTAVLALVTMIGGFITLQFAATLRFLGAVFTVTAFFSAICLIAGLWNDLRVRCKRRKLSQQMDALHTQLTSLHEERLSEITQCYEHDLRDIEAIHRKIHKIERLYEINQENYRLIERHRKLLENFEDSLIGILNCFHFSTSDVKKIETFDFFDIQKAPNDPINTVYRPLSIETIDEIFNA